MQKANPLQTRQILKKGLVSVNAFSLAEPRQGEERPSNGLAHRDHVPWFDTDNSFPAGVLERSRLSTTHGRILQDKTTFSCGNGILVEGAQKKAVRARLDAINGENESMEDVLEKVFTDWWTFGNANIYITEADGQRFFSTRDMSCLRVRKPDKGFCTSHLLYSRDWRNPHMQGFEPVAIPLYPNFEPIPNGEGMHSILHIKKYHPSYFYYGLIDYYSAYFSGWLDLDYHIPRYNLNRFKNQFRPSGMLVLVGQNLTEEEAQAIEQEARNVYLGEGNAGKLLIATVNDESLTPKYIPFNDAAEAPFQGWRIFTN